MTDDKQPNPLTAVQRHVDRRSDRGRSLEGPRHTRKQRGEIGIMLQDVAVRSITTRSPKVTWMSAGVAAQRNTIEGVGQKGRPSHRVEVRTLFAAPRPYGWQIFRGKGAYPIIQSPVGFTSEADAWTAGGAALTQLFRVERRRR